jgi:hypothetical protein
VTDLPAIIIFYRASTRAIVKRRFAGTRRSAADFLVLRIYTDSEINEVVNP